jgi:hypothetical protein
LHRRRQYRIRRDRALARQQCLAVQGHGRHQLAHVCVAQTVQVVALAIRLRVEDQLVCIPARGDLEAAGLFEQPRQLRAVRQAVQDDCGTGLQGIQARLWIAPIHQRAGVAKLDQHLPQLRRAAIERLCRSLSQINRRARGTAWLAATPGASRGSS